MSDNKTNNKLFNNYFKILYNYVMHNQWGYSLAIKKIMTCVMQQDMTHERTELWMCFLLDYDVFVQLSQNQLSSIHLKSFRALVSIVLNKSSVTSYFALRWLATLWTLKCFEHFLKIKLDHCMFYNVKQHAQKMNLEYKIMWNLVQSHLKCQKIK